MACAPNFSFHWPFFQIFSRKPAIRENIFVLYNGLLLPKNSSLTKYVDEAIGLMQAAGLITHYMNDPLYLENFMPEEIFTFYDDSKDKLTMETFTLLFIYLAVGMLLALMALIAEVIVYWRKKSRGQPKPARPTAARRQSRASKKRQHRVFIGKWNK